MAVFCSCIAMECDPTQSTLVHSSYLYVNHQSECMSGMFMQSHAKSCNVCKVSRQVESYTCSVNFSLRSQRFACIQVKWLERSGWREVVGEKWLSTCGRQPFLSNHLKKPEYR